MTSTPPWLLILEVEVVPVVRGAMYATEQRVVMPALPSPKHERFASGLAKGRLADEAYALVGFKPNRGNATRLKANDSIRKRVKEILSGVAKRAEWSAADRLLSLKAIQDKAAETDGRIAIAAIAEANKMQGSYPPAQHRRRSRWRANPDHRPDERERIRS